jgi:hypothetical protein
VPERMRMPFPLRAGFEGHICPAAAR